MSEEQKRQEGEVFAQELSLDDLNAAAGGLADDTDNDPENCSRYQRRKLYGGPQGFPNCASSLRDGESCDRGDACLREAVRYTDMHYCNRAWS